MRLPPVHPAAELFPLLTGAEFDALVEDIREHGQREPVVMYRGQILDGRNRWRACAEARVTPKTREWDGRGSPIDFVISLNVKRRHLTPVQAATVAAAATELFEAEARERQRSGKSADGSAGGRGRRKPSVHNARKVTRSERESTTRAARAVGAGARATRVMVSIKQNAPEVLRATKEGLVATVSDAVALSKLSPEQRAAAIEALRGGDQTTVKDAIKHQKRLAAQAVARELEQRPRSELWSVHECDVRDALTVIAPGSVDAIVTDPPYEEGALPLYSALAETASKILRPGGSCFVMTGQSYLPEVVARLGEHLRYHWTLAYLTPGAQAPQLWARKVNTFWKPVLWFVQGKYAGEWIGDVVRSDPNDNDKRFHDWGQSESGMAALVERCSAPGDLICDPFCGGGTTGVVALALGRRFVGIDRDGAAVLTAQGRLAS